MQDTTTSNASQEDIVEKNINEVNDDEIEIEWDDNF